MAKRNVVLIMLVLLAACSEPPGSQAPATVPQAVTSAVPAAAADTPATLDAFFADITDRWVASNPDQAIATGYFSGEQQDALERQLTPRTREYQQQRFAEAHEVLQALEARDFSQGTPTQQFAAETRTALLQQACGASPMALPSTASSCVPSPPRN